MEVEEEELCCCKRGRRNCTEMERALGDVGVRNLSHNNTNLGGVDKTEEK